MKIIINCDNPFRMGWLFQHLGGNREDFLSYHDSLKDYIFSDGYKMGEETGDDKHDAYLAELEMEYFKVSISDDMEKI